MTAVVAIGAVADAAGAQSVDSGTARVDLVANDDGTVQVVVSGLAEEIGGQVIVYQCANADRAGVAAPVTAATCYAEADGPERYVVVDITAATVELAYPLASPDDAIGTAGGRCLEGPGLEPCELQVGIATEDGAILLSISLPTAATDEPSTGGLAHTGLSGERTAVLAAVGLLLMYLGWLAWSAVPAPLRRLAS